MRNSNRSLILTAIAAFAALFVGPAPNVAVGEKPAGTRSPAGAAAAGYKALPAGTVRIWDTNKKYTQKRPSGAAMGDKPKWTAVPYGKTDYQPRGDLMLENDYLYLFLFTNKGDSVDLMAKMTDKMPGMKSGRAVSNEIYKVHDTGRRNYGHGTMRAPKILKYTPREIIIEHAGEGHVKSLPIVTTYRVLGGKPWLEVGPVERVNNQGMHGKNRICAFLNRDADELILDGKRATFTRNRNIPAPPEAIGIINFHRRYRRYNYDFMWFLTATPGFEKSKLSYLGLHADPFWEDDIPDNAPDRPSCGAQFVHMIDKVVIGVLNRKDVWKREDVLKPIAAGATYTSTFKAPYPGKWRVIGFVVQEENYKPRPRVERTPIPASFGTPIKGKYHYSTVEIKKPGERFTFKSPVAGTLDYLLIYLQDRTKQTPADVFTPMDVYRQAILGKAKGKLED